MGVNGFLLSLRYASAHAENPSPITVPRIAPITSCLVSTVIVKQNVTHITTRHAANCAGELVANHSTRVMLARYWGRWFVMSSDYPRSKLAAIGQTPNPRRNITGHVGPFW